MKLNGEFFGFIEELPALNARGRTLAVAREALQSLAAEVFAEHRQDVAETHAAAAVLREKFFLSAAAR